MLRRHSTTTSRRRIQVIAWGSILVVLVGLTVTPGIRHGEVETVRETETPPATVEPMEDGGIVILRRVRHRRPVVTTTNEAESVEVAHHGAESSGNAHFVHTHDGRNPHVHYTVLGLEMTIPVSGEGERGEMLVADAGDVDSATKSVEGKSKPPAFPTLQRPAPRTGNGEMPAASGGYVNPARVALPDPTPAESLFASVALPASPVLDGDAPVPRLPRV